MRLPSLHLLDEKGWPAAAGVLLPLTTAAHPRETWAPLLAYLIFNDLASKSDQEDKAAVFDRLHLRAAVAEAFQSLGSDGDQPWRVSARVRLLLAKAVPSIGSKELWSNPDARWLAGVNESDGATYFNKEQLEELASWLQLPALLSAATAELDPDRPAALAKVGESLAEVTAAASGAGYKLDHFLAHLNPRSAMTQSVTQLTPEQTAIRELEPTEEPIEAPLPFNL